MKIDSDNSSSDTHQPPQNDSTGLTKRDAKDPNPSSQYTGGVEFLYVVVYLVTFIDAFIFGFAIDPGTLTLRFFLYFLVCLCAFFVLGHSLEYALKTYTLISLGQLLVPGLLSLFLTSVPFPVPDIVTGNLTLAIMLFPWWVVYLQVNGYSWTPRQTVGIGAKRGSNLWDYIRKPSLWPKIIYSILIFFILLNALFSVAGHPAMEYLESDGISPSEGLNAFTNILGGGITSTWNNVVITGSEAVGIEGPAEIDPEEDEAERNGFTNMLISLGLIDEPDDGPDGDGYRSQAERNIFGVETDIDIPIRGSLTTAHGREYSIPIDITFDSVLQESNLTTTCILAETSANSVEDLDEEDIVHEEVIPDTPVGGSRSTLFTEFCDLPDDLEPGQYTFFATAEFPFTTQAATTYYFASSQLFSADRDRYLSEVRRLDAENVEAVHSTGGATIATDSRDQRLVPDRPILLDRASSQQFRYGFAIQPEDGTVKDIERIEMHIPQGLNVEGCTVEQGGTRDRRSVYEAYQVDPESLLTSSQGVKYTFCSLEYDADRSDIDEIYSFFIPSENRINDVALSIYADYTYQIQTNLQVTVPEPPETSGAEEQEEEEAEE